MNFVSRESQCFPRRSLGKHWDSRETKFTVPLGTSHQVLTGAYHLKPSSPNWGGATAFSQVDLFLEYDIISHASYPPPRWTNKKVSYYTVQLFKMADELDSSSSEFSPIQVPLLLILLWNKVFWKAKLRIVVKKQLTLNAKVLMVNGENHQRQN